MEVCSELHAVDIADHHFALVEQSAERQNQESQAEGHAHDIEREIKDAQRQLQTHVDEGGPGAPVTEHLLDALP